MNQAGERIKCEYCESLNECGALECRHCGATLAELPRTAAEDEAKRNQARELLKQAVQQFEQAGKNFGEARTHFEGAENSLKQRDD
jgi:hypothetical protein